MRSLAIKQKIHTLSTARIIPLGFFLLIVVGTLLLLLPVSTAPGNSTDFVTALFTSTTSVCVTGLVVVDTFSHWTIFGKVVILILIQFGGLGVITVSSAFLMALRRKMSLKDNLLIMDAFNLSSLKGLSVFLRKVIAWTFSIEALGAALYMIAFVPEFGWGKGITVSVFTSISAFCNAGIDIIGPDSLMPYSSDPLVLIVTMALIIIGGLGFVVVFDIFGIRRHKRYRLGEHTKLVLSATGILILTGAVLFFIFEFSSPDTMGKMSVGDKILNSFFQSVTCRTAGFASVSQKALSAPSTFLSDILMFIGGSPVGTAGGVKTVTVCILLVNTLAFIKKSPPVVFRRRISGDMIRKATAIITVSFLLVLIFGVAITAACGLELTDGVFEVISAFGTVGLSRGVTAGLNVFGRLMIIAAMFMGRIGPISMALFFNARKAEQANVAAAEGKFFVG